MTKALLIEHGQLVTGGVAPEIVENGSILIRDGVIEQVAPGTQERREMKENHQGDVLDAANRIVMPGFINAHMHCYSLFARGLGPVAPTTGFQQVLEHLWWPLDETLTREDIYLSALVSLKDSIRRGVTTVIDHHESQNAQPGALDALAKAFRETGVRGCLSLGVSNRRGRGKEGLEENRRFLETCATDAAGPRLLSGAMGLHALFTVNQDTLEACIRQANEMGVGLHVHLAEAEEDQQRNLEQYGMTAAARLYQAGGSGPRTLAAHGVHASLADLDLLASTRTCLVHNPCSNMNNAVGVAPLEAMLERGLTVGLGTDGMSPTPVDDVMTAYLLQALKQGKPLHFMVPACRMLLEHNPQIARRLCGVHLGVLEPGARADITILDYDPPTPFTTESFPGHFMFGLRQAPVHCTIVEGRILMHNGQFTQLDEPAINAKSRAAAKAFQKRLKSQSGY